MPLIEEKDEKFYDLLLIENGRNETNKFYEKYNPQVEEVKKRFLG